MHRSEVLAKFQLNHIRYVTDKNTLQIILHDSGGHFGVDTLKNKICLPLQDLNTQRNRRFISSHKKK